MYPPIPDYLQKPTRSGHRALSRRAALTRLGAALSTGLLPGAALAQDAAEAAPGTPFSFEALSERMQRESRSAPAAATEIDGFLAGLGYDDYQRIRFRGDRARWSEETDGRFRLQAFHLGWLFKQPVTVSEIVDGQAVPMIFSTRDFEYDSVTQEVPENLDLPGVAGFRLHNQLNRADIYDELVAFLGASYFRALGKGNTYGLSARGLAVNTGMAEGEEFPRFTEFWIERPAPGAASITLYAALQSRSVTGAYRFVITPGPTTAMDVTARLYLRRDIAQLGISPLTSMFLFDGADPGPFYDYRAAVHDSSALVLNMGETTFFRPLNNPPRLAASYLGAQSPRSFGLVQRERAFDQYLDAQAHYERRPSLMVEPLGDWGRGTVRLLEIPSDLEANDNIVAYWVPEAPARAGDALEFAYRLHWGMSPPGDRAEALAQVLRTRSGEGGVSGVRKETDHRKFVIDFQGGLLRNLPADADVEAEIAVQNGSVVQSALSLVSGTDIWRLVIDVEGEPETTVELKASLSGFGRTLSETWLYQWVKE
ncbi:glucan biosynthesis protein G [Salipiger sp. P9]|uniref:glucan biosynthesis protein n=1 Tax=Salipiger pentaromativorans TaxID=2943193 RepID=UPI0021575F35|nr:glucan biosynthesis protein G [Salipiger pentaromativorans]MCR8550995.1 glucan biosynthesis protein G [Salipiger pentaromativorans]